MPTDNDLPQCSLKDLNLQPTPSYRREEQDSGSVLPSQEAERRSHSGEEFPKISRENSNGSAIPGERPQLVVSLARSVAIHAYAPQLFALLDKLSILALQDRRYLNDVEFHEVVFRSRDLVRRIEGEPPVPPNPTGGRAA